jgi:fibronectin-binding autotransporter adhesin
MPHPLARLLAALVILAAPTCLHAQAFLTWNGTGNNWNDFSQWTNWSSGSFPYGQLEWTGGGNVTSNNDFTPRANAWRLFFNGNTAYTITGNEIGLTNNGTSIGGIMSRATGNQTFEATVNFRTSTAGEMFVVTRIGGSGTGGGGGNLNLGNITISRNVTALRFGGESGAGRIRVNGSISELDGAKPIIIGRDHNDAVQSATFVELLGNNTYSGGTTFRAGTLRLGHDNALGTGRLTIDGEGTSARVLASSSSSNRTLANGLDLYNDNLTLGQSSPSSGTGSLIFTGTVRLGTEDGQDRSLAVLGTHTFAGAVSGNRSFTKTGSGTLVFAAANTYLGDTFINAGALRFATGSSLANGTIRLGDTAGTETATLEIDAGVNLAGSGSRVLVVRDGSTGNKFLSSTATSGTATLSRNTFLDANLNTQSASGGTFAITSGTFDLKGQTLFVGGAGNTLIFSSLSSNSSGKLVKQDAGSLSLTGNNSIGGGIYIDQGTISFDAGSLGAGALDLGTTVSALTNSTATLAIGASGLTSNRNITVQTGGNRTLAFNQASGESTLAGTLTLNKAVTINVANADSTGVLSGTISGSGGPLVTVQGAGTLRPTATDSSTSARWSVESGATLAIADTRNLGANPAGHYDNKITLAGGTLRAIDSFTSNANVGLNAAASSSISVDASRSLTFRGGISGSAPLAKTGAGTLNLSHASTNHTYSGTWTVQAGTLLVNTSNPGAVTVNSGATLGGNATISGLVTLNSGATLSPGNSLGTMNLNNGLTLDSTSTVRMDIAATTGNADRINITSGLLTRAGNLVFNTVALSGVPNNTYTLFTGSQTGTWATVTAAGDYTGAFTNNGGIWTRNTGDGTLWTYNESLGTLAVVPEPKTYALLALGTALLLWRLRPWKRRQSL